MQQFLQEFNHLVARYTPVVQFDLQVNPSRFRRDQQGTYQIGALVMVETGSYDTLCLYNGLDTDRL
jgi:hypothetical protein